MPLWYYKNYSCINKGDTKANTNKLQSKVSIQLLSIKGYAWQTPILTVKQCKTIK